MVTVCTGVLLAVEVNSFATLFEISHCARGPIYGEEESLRRVLHSYFIITKRSKRYTNVIQFVLAADFSIRLLTMRSWTFLNSHSYLWPSHVQEMDRCLKISMKKDK